MPQALLVDDDIPFVLGLAEAVKREGFRVTTATSLKGAREELSHSEPKAREAFSRRHTIMAGVAPTFDGRRDNAKSLTPWRLQLDQMHKTERLAARIF